MARGDAQASAGAELEWGEGGGVVGQETGPSRGHRALAGWNAAISVPDEAWIALTSRLTLPSAGPLQMVVLACPPAWGPTWRIVRASGAVHSFTVCGVLPVYLDPSPAAFPRIGIERVTVTLV